MYDRWCSRFPRRLVDVAYCAWYASLILLVVLLLDKPALDFYYLHG